MKIRKIIAIAFLSGILCVDTFAQGYGPHGPPSPAYQSAMAPASMMQGGLPAGPQGFRMQGLPATGMAPRVAPSISGTSTYPHLPNAPQPQLAPQVGAQHQAYSKPMNSSQIVVSPGVMMTAAPPPLTSTVSRQPSVMEQALSLHKAGRYSDAVHLYESVIYSSAPDPRLYASIADAHFRLGNNERALKYVVEALKLDPAYSSAHLLIGTILGEMGDYVRAIRSYKKVLVLDQNNPYAYYNLGLLHYKKSDVRPAIEYLEKARELNPKDAKIWNNLGVVYYDQGMYPQALVAFSEALRLTPGYKSAERNLALVKKKAPSLPAPPMRKVSLKSVPAREVKLKPAPKPPARKIETISSTAEKESVEASKNPSGNNPATLTVDIDAPETSPPHTSISINGTRTTANPSEDPFGDFSDLENW